MITRALNFVVLLFTVDIDPNESDPLSLKARVCTQFYSSHLNFDLLKWRRPVSDEMQSLCGDIEVSKNNAFILLSPV